VAEPARQLEARAELDEVTLRRAQRGDEGAFRDLVSRYHVMVFDLLWRMVEHARGGARAEELSQETFLRVWKGLPRFRPGGPAKLSTWILTIATRVALNDLRRKEAKVVALEAIAARPSAATPADAEIEQRRAAEAVRQAIAGLSPEHRAVLVLREYHELEYAEIASALELDPGTVKSRLSRARSALREKLDEVRHG